MIKYFKKRIPKTPIFGTDGTPIKFDLVDANLGVLATDNPQIIADLEKAIAGERGGIIAITVEEYNDLKKNANWTPSSEPSRDAMEEFLPPVLPDTIQVSRPRPDVAQSAVNRTPTGEVHLAVSMDPVAAAVATPEQAGTESPKPDAPTVMRPIVGRRIAVTAPTPGTD